MTMCHLVDKDKKNKVPGDMFYDRLFHASSGCYAWKENCTTPHLIVILPGGWAWDMDSRASNCNMRDDNEHRCWIKHGEPPNITVNKQGKTCGAGGGSINAPGNMDGSRPGWHGFLQNGELVSV